MVCEVWLARDFLHRTNRPVDIPPCPHPETCPPLPNEERPDMSALHIPQPGHECVPTQDAYDAAVRALNKHRNRADGLALVMKEIAEKAQRFAMIGGRSEMQDALLTIRTVAEHAVEDDQRDRAAQPAQS